MSDSWVKKVNKKQVIDDKIRRFERLIGCEYFIENKIYNSYFIDNEYFCMSENKQLLSNVNNEKYWRETK